MRKMMMTIDRKIKTKLIILSRKIMMMMKMMMMMVMKAISTDK